MIRAPLEIYSNRSGLGLAQKICGELTKLRAGDAADAAYSCDTNLKKAQVRPGKDIFACGEFKVMLEDSVRGKDVFLVQCAIDRSDSTRSIQDNIWETLQTIEAMRGCHAEYINVILPLLPYSRQDKTDGRESFGGVVLAKAIAAMGANQVITFDLHAQQIKGFYRALDVPLDSLYVTHQTLDVVRSTYRLEDIVVLPPDEGSVKRGKYYADNLFGEANVDETKLINAIKYRNKNQVNKIDALRILGNVAGKTVIVPEDLVDTGGSITAVSEAAYAQGAKGVVVCATHAALSDPATSRLDKLYAEGKLISLLTTDTVPQPRGYAEKHPWFKCYSVAPLLAEIIDKINKEEKTSHLYI